LLSFQKVSNFGPVAPSITIYLIRNPDIVLKYVNKEKEFARIIEPFTCYDLEMRILDNAEKEKYRIFAHGNQCGISWRGSVFGRCYEVYFPIFSSNNPSINKEGADGMIHKKHSACIDDDNYESPEAIEVLFPKSSTPEDKFSLICLALCIDYKYYEENPHEVQSEAKLEG
jgi:hypothetical protein